jgi:hypothetical protein
VPRSSPASSSHRRPGPGSTAVLAGVVVCVSAGLLAYSQTLAFYGDEGFDLLAAQLIAAGKRPYIDFFYQHTPFFADLTAWWMRLFGQGWRSVHVLSALLTSAAVAMAAGWVRSRISDEGERRSVGASVATAGFIGLQYLVMKYATTAQAYGACLFLCMAAFRVATARRPLPTVLRVAATSMLAGAAAASSLLAAPVAPVLTAWLIAAEPRGKRVGAAGAALAGLTIPFIPLLILYAAAPYQTWFDTVTYHLSYRSNGWPLQWDLSVLGSAADSAQGALLLLLAVVGLLLVRRDRPGLSRDLTLCVALAAALGALAAAARPTFEQYFVLAIPFLAIPASIGAAALVARIGETTAQRTAIAMLIAVPFLVTPARLAHRLAGSQRTWPALEAIAQQVNHVTPPGGLIWANHIVYAAAARIPPSGLETSVRLSLPPAQAASVHVYSRADVEGWAREGRFDTVCHCDGDALSDDLRLAMMYRQTTRLHYFDVTPHSCDIFWDRRPR